MKTDVWGVYEELCRAIPGTATADAFVAGLHWFGVRSADGLGMAMAPTESAGAPAGAGTLAGSPLAELAARSRSWNFAEAALGMAAINAWHNTPSRVDAWCRASGYDVHSDGSNAFETMLPRVAGKRVAVIGHFRGLEKMAEVCDLTILERRPQPGDLPDPACEAVLPESDFVFITGVTLINKTLPRLLALARDAFVVMAGPTVPLTPVLFEHGVDMLAGLVVDEIAPVWQIVQEGGQHTFFNQGTRMVQIERRKG